MCCFAGIRAYGAASGTKKTTVEEYGAVFLEYEQLTEEYIRKVCPEGFNLVIDSFGGKNLEKSMTQLKEDGKTIGYGFLGGRLNPAAFITAGLRMKIKFPGKAYAFYNVESKDNLAYLQDDFREIFDYAGRRLLSPLFTVSFHLISISWLLSHKRTEQGQVKFLLKLYNLFMHRVTNRLQDLKEKKMKKISVLFIILTGSFSTWANGNGEKITDARTGEGRVLEISIEQGEEYLHDFPLFLFFKLKNSPQMVFWAETTDGKYLETLFVTQKSGRQGWLRASGDPLTGNMIRRPEALPVWAWKRNVLAADGLPMPTKDQPLTDEISQASPKEGFSLLASSADGLEEFVVCLEVNHSTDFNERYMAESGPGDPDYNGGKYGSGQPSLVCRAVVKLSEPDENGAEFKLIGHGSASGADGRIYEDLSGIDSALKIIESVRVHWENEESE